MSNIEEVLDQNNITDEAATTANSPKDLAKDNSTENSNLDDSNTTPEEITKSQQKEKGRRKLINWQGKRRRKDC